MVTSTLPFHNAKMELCPIEFTGRQQDGYMSDLLVLQWNYCGTRCFQIIYFCPWSGKELPQSRWWYARNKLSEAGIANAYTDSFNFVHDVPNSLTPLVSDEAWKTVVNTYQQQHGIGYCAPLQESLDKDRGHGIPIIHIPNIRTYAILRKKEYGGFEPMDYCPFCGAKFPERLDEKLTEILQKEYGLNSWKDYKKAPHEFQTDEWWVKRGL